MKMTSYKLKVASLALMATFFLQNNSLAANENASGDVACQLHINYTANDEANSGLNNDLDNNADINFQFHITKKNKNYEVNFTIKIDDIEIEENFPAKVTSSKSTYTLIGSDIKLMYPIAGGPSELYFEDEKGKWKNAINGTYEDEYGLTTFTGQCHYTPVAK